MRIINKYLSQDYLVTFGMTLLIFTFVMCLGVVIKAIDIASRGVSGMFILKIFAYNVPYMMTFSIPMSVITTVLLLFGRLSFDGEITAMKASGISMWQIIAPLIILSIGLSLVCFSVNTTIAPYCRHAARTMLLDLGVDEPINLLEPGRFVRDFPGLIIYVGSRDDKTVEDVVVYEMGDDGPVRNVRARHGQLRVDKNIKAMFIDLFDVRIDQREKDSGSSDEKSHYINADHYPVKLDFSRLHKKSAHPKVADMTFMELVETIRDVRAAFPELQYDDLLRQRMSMLVEANKRLALSLSCFAFTLLGIPLGMKSKRKESTIGVGISLLLVFGFYLFIIIANALVGHPELHPDMIVWIPVVLSEILGFYLIAKTN